MKDLDQKAAYTYLSTVLSQILQGTIESFVNTDDPELYSIPKNIHGIIITSLRANTSLADKGTIGEAKLREIKAQLREGSLKFFEQAGVIEKTCYEERQCVLQ